MDFEKTLSAMPNFGSACYSVLHSWGYSFDEAVHEGRVVLFLLMSEGIDLEYPQTYVTNQLRWREISQHRKSKCLEFVDCEIPYEHAEFDIDEFLKSLNGLTKPQKELVLLNKCAGYSQDEIAQLLDLPIGTIKSRMSRACNRLKQVRVK